jgi:hypothetical protein
MAETNEQILHLYTIHHEKKIQELKDCYKQEQEEFRAEILKLQEELAKVNGELAQFEKKEKEADQIENVIAIKQLWTQRLQEFKLLQDQIERQRELATKDLHAFSQEAKQQLKVQLSNSQISRLGVKCEIQNQTLIHNVIQTHQSVIQTTPEDKEATREFNKILLEKLFLVKAKLKTLATDPKFKVQSERLRLIGEVSKLEKENQICAEVITFLQKHLNDKEKDLSSAHLKHLELELVNLLLE